VVVGKKAVGNGYGKRKRSNSMMMKKAAAVVLSAGMALSLAACGSSASNSGSASASGASAASGVTAASSASSESVASSSTATAGNGAETIPIDEYKEDPSNGKEMNIGVILKTQSSEFGQYLQAGCERYEKDHPNIHLDITGPSSETAYDEQINMITTDLSSGKYDALCVIPLQSDSAAKLIEDATIPVVAFDTKINSDKVATFVGVGNEVAAEGGAKQAVEMAKANGWEEIKCIEIAGVQGDENNTARMNGYKKGIEESGGDFMDDEVQYANAVADQAVTCMEAIISNHPEGVAIICANNDDMAMAAYKAAKGNEAYKNTIFLGFDGIQAPSSGLVSGELTNYISVATKPYDMGYYAIDSAIRAANGEDLADFYDTGFEVLTKDNAAERLETLKGYLGQ
jgi:ABC-type sugar transport system substrate-binding protein